VNKRKPRIVTVLGDPAGIGPELVGRLLADPATTAQADILLLADAAELQRGMDLAGTRTAVHTIGTLDNADLTRAPAHTPLLLDVRGDTRGPLPRGVSSAEGGHYSLGTLALGLQAVQQGMADAMLFAPLNKHSLHMAGMKTADELHWFAEQLNFSGPVGEFNVLDGLWTSRVTSHIPLRDVAEQITAPGVIRAIQMIAQAMAGAGIAQPRIAVCGLNPHNGDNGSFGREEIDIIGPAVEAARARGIPAQGPFAADTIFLKVQGEQRQYDGVVTMYHDQGQIAMKLMGFQRGVTVQGGLPVPITTPAHGTAFDIAGRGVANAGAMTQAFQLACRMALARIQ
jgi:4-hydroxythreonine-4-phosphate dehydrogenase